MFLATSDEFTAKAGAELCGRRDRLKANYAISEAGQGAHVSLLAGGPTAVKQTLSTSKRYAPHHGYIFAPRVFTELQNAQAIALPYAPESTAAAVLLPEAVPTGCETSYFDHVARGAL